MTYLANEHRYESLPLRRAGTSGLDLPTFSFGLWQKFGTDYAYDTQREIILRAFDLGITHFDIANRYGPPFRAAEKLFGRLLKSDLGRYREELVISSKAGGFLGDSPYLQGGSRKSLLGSLDHSLRDLGVDYVDIFYHHRPDLTVPLEETTSALADAVRHGKALYVGISNYAADRAHEATQLLSAQGVPLLVHQHRYSIFDRRVETEGLLSFAQAEGVGLVVFSPLAQGLLTDKYLDGEIPRNARAAASAFLSPDAITEEYIARARALNEIAADRGQSLAQLALQWVLRQPQVSTALIGASSAWQLDHNLAALQFPPLSDEELGQIDEYGIHGTGVRV
ncbi:MAG: aldo/keto reductase [Solirubrobacteraceae bacterium]